MSRKQERRKAWDAFWNQSQARGPAHGGCLPDAWQGIDRKQTEVWAAFARNLPRGARVLDLATGDGRVMAKLLHARRDLKPLGIDQATSLPPAPKGTKVHTGVLMRDLPFPIETFAAITSQFGFEYGDVEAAAAQVQRVLKKEGKVALMTHREDSPILAHNRQRREQIVWAIEQQDLPGKAKRSLQLRQMGIATIPPEIEQAPAHGAARFGQSSAAWEIAEAVRRTLLLSRNEPPARTAAVIDQIVAQAQNELSRIESLEMATATAGTGDAIAQLLAAQGLDLIASEALHDKPGDAPFATFLVLTKPE